MTASTSTLFAALVLTSPAAAHSVHENFAAGAPGDPTRAARTVAVTIRESGDGTMSFGTGGVSAAPGEQLRFVVRNDGTAPHEFRIDSVAGNAAHKAMMARMPGMTHHDGNAVEISPGASVDLVWRFTKPGTYEFACLIPGHYEAGMHGRIVVGR